MLEQPVYAIDDVARVRDLVHGYGWATIVSALPTGPVVSHAPVLLDADDPDGLTVVSHLGRPDDELHELGRHPVAVVVQGPQGYVTPAFYEGGPYTPSWDFVVVHLHGTPELLDPEETFDVLERTVDHFERSRPDPFRLSSVIGYARRIAPGVAGFRLRPERVVAKAKLSQDKPPADLEGVVRGLEHDPVHASPGLAAYMRGMGLVG